MKTELDLAMDRTFGAMTAEGGMFRTVPIRRFDHDLPMIAAAPPHLPAYFAYFCATHGDKTFIVDGETRLSFADVYKAARHVAGGLVDGLKLQKGERVGIAARNSSNWVIAYMAVLMAGGCATLLNGWWQGEELAAGIDLVECRYLIADASRAARLEGHAHGATVLPMAHDCPYADGLAALLAHGGGMETTLPSLTGDDLATVLFTSGSTGMAKGAYSDHRGVVQGTMNYVAQTAAMLGILTARGEAPAADVQPTTLVNVPLFHVTGEVPVFLQSFAIGRKLVLMPKWDAVEAMRLIQQEKVTYFVGVPLMSFEIATHPDRDKYDLSTCVSFAAGGAPRPVEHVDRIRKALPHAFPLLGYGLTETNGVGCGNLNENYMAKPGSTGTASRPLVDLAILDDAGNALPQGEVGEVSIRSIANFLGYWNNEKATREAITADGYFRTGDLGYLDPEGYLFIVDRKKDIIIRGGENISCIEVESAIYAHPCIAEASVFGLPDEKLGEVPAAVYLAKDDCSATSEELQDFLKAHIAPFKVPVRFWEVHEALPRLGTEKVDKRTLRDRYTKEWLASCS
ncbi:MAG: AMP-dependent synthetase [Novosphingobium sp. 28-62-57]|uniref:class I adenylate-forming enzyme family protein n=1 Tax=unclassified Novosphingobium TaxID=2644732 RepID=UPI000BD014D2|nr:MULTISPECIES: class I adenylate-forming enzyme family protein [unclassified Novosphingobium]OYW49163.1 MAG: AMP-dependent synthetase [Novosphingobium sp. 12-62-10]OYZ09808.1 MAG: AMP-dependent synthetase [Novosphingobium sp. 28-62-57]OZA32732.1 MAG: AMP-dependent synthetase [Novosphingobium sp. 17-62-9]HQS70688.1 class I adenylate-forming enzyme family protein [Novosphingobium sp.]